jgi:hypothetical protein
VIFLLLGSHLYSQVKIEQMKDTIGIEINGKPFTDLYMGPECTKPFLHPLRSAHGTIVTRRFPMEEVEGESRDHKHQRGLWFAHSNVNGFDFWNNESSYTTPNRGRIQLNRVRNLKSGAKDGSIEVSFDWKDPSGNVLLTENRTMTFYADPVDRVIDFGFELIAATDVTFADVKDGIFGIRVASGLESMRPGVPLNPVRSGTMVNSNGASGEKDCWGKRASWIDYFGTVDGEKVGIAIFDNPANPRPGYWHSRGYGLFAINITGAKEFTHDPNADASLHLRRGDPLRLRYRVVIHPGDYKEAKIAELYSVYAHEQEGSRK